MIHVYPLIECYTGQLRLVGGETEMEGRVEVCTSYSRWGTICDKQWAPSHTRVVCRNLGYDDSEGKFMLNSYWYSLFICIISYCSYKIYSYIHFYVGTGFYKHTFSGSVIPIVMDYVNCSGSEVKLWDCPHFTHSYSGCSHSDDAGVRCQPGIHIHISMQSV